MDNLLPTLKYRDMGCWSLDHARKPGNQVPTGRNGLKNAHSGMRPSQPWLAHQGPEIGALADNLAPFRIRKRELMDRRH